MRLLIITFILSISMTVFSKDYSLCAKYIKNGSVGDYVVMSSDGKIKQHPDAMAYDSQNENNITIKYKRFDSKNNKFRYDSTVSVQKKPDQIIIRIYKATNRVTDIGKPGSELFEKKLSEAYKTPTRIDEEQLFYNALAEEDGIAKSVKSDGQTYFQLSLRFKNNKCYPSSFTLSTYQDANNNPIPIKKNGEKEVDKLAGIPRTFTAEKCRGLKFYFKEIPNPMDKITDTNYIRLVNILKGSYGVWRYVGKSLAPDNEYDTDTPEEKMRKILRIAYAEKALCKNFEETINDESLWTNQNPNTTEENQNNGSATIKQ